MTALALIPVESDCVRYRF